MPIKMGVIWVGKKQGLMNGINKLMSKKKSKRGGKRIGSGRKKKAPTTTVSFRVKVEHAEPVKQVVSDLLTSYSFEKTEKGEKKKKKKLKPIRLTYIS